MIDMEELELEPEPFTSGGAKDIHKGTYNGSAIAAKVVHTGDVEDRY